ncbi:MAG: glycosyltransferase family 2 protein [Pseudomonadales bacterium]|nr:glycosyltransferase family 2 protein [Pseudomonadales bacterium]
MKPSVCIIIPALNEEETLPVLLDMILSQVAEVIVVDNGSEDDTSLVAKSKGAKLVFEPRRGYGQACLSGIAAAQEHDILVFLDADLSDDPRVLSKLLEPILRGEADFVVSSRMGVESRKAMSWVQRNGNRFACLLMNWRWRANYTDLGPFRAITMAALKTLDMKDLNYGWTVEMQIKACKKRLRVRELEVPYGQRAGGKSKVSGTLSGVVKAGSKILYIIAKEAIF